MKIAVILRDFPVPIYTGMNVIINNVLKRIILKYQIKLFILDAKDELVDNCLYDYDMYKIDSNFEHNENTFNICRIAKYYRTEKKRVFWLNNRLNEYKPDRIVGFGYDLLGYFGLIRIEIPKVLDVIDSEMLYLWREILKGKLNLNTSKHLVASIMLSKRYLNKCDSIITVSEDDTTNIKKMTGFLNIHTIPNGVDFDFYCPDHKIKKDVFKIVFSGSMNWSPNKEAIKWFVKNCWGMLLKEVPGAKLIIIGKLVGKEMKNYLESYENVEVLGFVDDIRNHIRSSQLSVVPMVSGSGIKNKILEAWALGQPVVATPLATRGLICKNNEDILIAELPKQFVSQIVKLFKDEELAKKLGKSGRQNVINNYSWEKVVEQFVATINNVVVGQIYN